MKIAGLQKMTLLDYPGKVACTVFLQGCNFRCPFCHNSDLLDGVGQTSLTQQELLAFLGKRRGLLDGVCITGGEPTLQPDLPQLLEEIRALGFSIKLDTNGSRPEVLRRLVERGLVDYVAMDIKNGPASYAVTAGMAESLLPRVAESMRFLLSDAVDYEFRTTLVDELHTEATIQDMGFWIKNAGDGHKAKRLYLQSFVDRESVVFAGRHAPSREKIHIFQQILLSFAEAVEIRGTE